MFVSHHVCPLPAPSAQPLFVVLCPLPISHVSRAQSVFDAIVFCPLDMSRYTFLVISIFARNPALSFLCPLSPSFSCQQVGEEAQQSVIRKVFQQVAQRPDSFCNYLDGSIPEWGEGVKLIYRHYATLYFVFAVDQQESDLGILDLIQGREKSRSKG